MQEFDIANLNCGHCVRAVTETLKEVDPAARVEIDLPAKHVKVESGVSRDALRSALAEAGYPPN